MRYLMMFIGLIIPLSVFAGEGSPEILDKILGFLNTALGAGTALTFAGGIAEYIFRKIKSKKPLSIFYAVSAILHSIGKISTKLGDLLDKIIPQKLK